VHTRTLFNEHNVSDGRVGSKQSKRETRPLVEDTNRCGTTSLSAFGMRTNRSFREPVSLSMSVGKHLGHTTKLSLTTGKMVIVEQYHIVYGKILLHLATFVVPAVFANIPSVAKTGPASPKLVSHALQLSPSPPSVTTRCTENAWRLTSVVCL